MVDTVNSMRKTVDKVNHPAEATAPEVAPAEIAELLHGLLHRMKRRLHESARSVAADEPGLAPMAWRALAYFARHPGASARDLVEHAGRDKGQVARLVSTLQERGLLAATPSVEDQRRIALHLTDEGRRIERQLAAHRRRTDAALTAGFSAAERRQLAEYLARMQAALDDAA